MPNRLRNYGYIPEFRMSEDIGRLYEQIILDPPKQPDNNTRLDTLNAKILSLESLVNGLVKREAENKEMIEYLKDMLEEEIRSKV